jgi:hypothetical protein
MGPRAGLDMALTDGHSDVMWSILLRKIGFLTVSKKM